MKICCCSVRTEQRSDKLGTLTDMLSTICFGCWITIVRRSVACVTKQINDIKIITSCNG